MRKLLALGLASVSVTGTALAAPSGQTGLFNTPCRFSHRAPDDPIVAPGRPGASHMHDFLGNTSTGAYSTLESLRASPALCKRGEDRSAYWVPTLYDDGNALAPYSANIYYRTAGREPRTIETLPQGLRVIADAVSWECTADARIRPAAPSQRFFRKRAARRRALLRLRRSARRHRGSIRRARRTRNRRAVRRHRRALSRVRVRILAQREALRAMRRAESQAGPTCAEGQVLKLSIRFPDCWDGRGLDSPDHRSHLAHSTRSGGAAYKTCPATHPRAVPKLTLSLKYASRGGPGVTLSSGPHYTAHADFFNAWDPAALQDLVRRCLNADVHCGTR